MSKQWRETHPGMELTQDEMDQDYLGLPPQRGFQKSFVFHGAQGNLFYRICRENPVIIAQRSRWDESIN